MTGELSLQLHQLRHAILGARDRGRVIVEFMDGPGDAIDASAARHLADAMLALCNLPVLGMHWRELTADRTRETLAAVLHEDLESERSRVPAKVAKQLAERVLARFAGSGAIYLSNVKPTADLSQSPHKWASGRVANELDAGVAIVTDSLVGLVWVEDRP